MHKKIVIFDNNEHVYWIELEAFTQDSFNTVTISLVLYGLFACRCECVFVKNQ